jgi:hypothetical protein
VAVDTHQRVERQRALRGRDGGVVLGRDVVDKAHQPPTARARHVLHHDRRIARQVAAEVARDEPRIGVISYGPPGAAAGF